MTTAISQIRLFLILTAVLGGVTVGCGIKGPPVPPSQYRPAAVDDLGFRLESGNLVLTWTAPPVSAKSESELAGCSVYRSFQSQAEGPCENCPVPYEKVTDISALPSRGGDPLADKMTFQETLTASGEYSYKVICFTEQGVAGGPSNIVNFTY